MNIKEFKSFTKLKKQLGVPKFCDAPSAEPLVRLTRNLVWYILMQQRSRFFVYNGVRVVSGGLLIEGVAPLSAKYNPQLL